MAGSLAERDVPRITVRNSKRSGKQNALAFSSHVINTGDVLISRGDEAPSAVPEAISMSFCSGCILHYYIFKLQSRFHN